MLLAFSFIVLALLFSSCAQPPYVQLMDESIRLRSQLRLVEAIVTAEKALKSAEETLGPEHPDVAIALNNLAEFHKVAGGFSKDEATRQKAAAIAEPMHKRALTIREKTLGFHHSFTLASMINLADVYQLQRRYAEAEALYKRALGILKEIGPRAPILGQLELQATIGLSQLDKERRKIEAAVQPDAVATERSYTNPVYRWSISYPADWTIDGKDPNFVRISSVADNGLCGIHSGAVRFNTVDELTDSTLAHNERFFRDKGLVFVILARQRISLPSDIIGNDVLTEIGPSGKSRRIYVFAGGQEFAVDCETYVRNWERLAPSFDRIIRSFTLRK